MCGVEHCGAGDIVCVGYELVALVWRLRRMMNGLVLARRLALARRKASSQEIIFVI